MTATDRARFFAGEYPPRRTTDDLAEHRAPIDHHRTPPHRNRRPLARTRRQARRIGHR